MNRFVGPAALAALVVLGTPASAHHSYAMFDSAKNLQLTGVVEQFKWTNPHSWIEIQAADGKGATVKWGVEMTSPAVLVRAGWRASTLKPGDQVIITIHPLRSGELGGAFVSVQLPDGRTLSDRPTAG